MNHYPGFLTGRGKTKTQGKNKGKNSIIGRILPLSCIAQGKKLNFLLKTKKNSLGWHFLFHFLVNIMKSGANRYFSSCKIKENHEKLK